MEFFTVQALSLLIMISLNTILPKLGEEQYRQYLKASIIIFVITSLFTPLTLIRPIQLGEEVGGCFDFRYTHSGR